MASLFTTGPSLGLLGRLWQPVSTFWQVLDALRRLLLNLLLLGLIVVLAWWWLRPGPTLQDQTALVLAPQGRLVEQAAATGRRGRLLRAARDQTPATQTRVRDLVAALDAAATDPRIPHALLLLDDFAGGGLPALREVAQAVERFKAAGKPVFAWGSGYDQAGWFIATHATEVWMHPQGLLLVDGFGRQRSHYRRLFERLGIEAHVLRAGRYKNALEPFAAAAPSAETLESEGLLWRTLWASYTGAVEKARGLPEGSIARALDSLPGSLAEVDGDGARWAERQRWVDRLITRDQLQDELLKRGAADDSGKHFRQIGLGGYLAQRPAAAEGGANADANTDAVGIVVAQGPIGDGAAGPGRIGGLSTAALVRRAREDERIKAVVLRVDSPGGSAFGSELVRRELELTRAAGKPVVVSMGNLAASGGYWISLAADEIVADEASITGSIGVVGLLPSVAPALERWGVQQGGVTTSWLRTAGDPRLPLDPRVRSLVQTLIDGGYRQFIDRVAAARGKTAEQVQELAQGRVWSGRDALALGLVDRLGGLEAAVASAATRARLGGERPPRRYLDVPAGRLDRWLDRLGVNLGVQAALDSWAGPEPDASATSAEAGALALLARLATPWTTELAELETLLSLSAPAGSGQLATVPAPLAHCLCGMD